jgi:16S rRNA (cytidine1402-2'-O)-methyltransferase
VSKGKLYMIPNMIASADPDRLFSPLWRKDISHIRFFLAEDFRSARQFLSSLKIYDDIGALHFEKLDRDTAEEEIDRLLKPLLDGQDMGILSESGCPGVADPGALAADRAHRLGITVCPLVGPSSILLSLMASGLNGQRFAFHGYLPIQEKELNAEIKKLEKVSRDERQTQIFIESPHRNNRLLSALKKQLSPSSRLCVACDLTGKDEKIVSLPVKNWPEWELPKMPCIFLFLA